MVYTLLFFLNAVCFIILTYLVPVFIHILYTGCAKIKKKYFRRQKVKCPVRTITSHIADNRLLKMSKLSLNLVKYFVGLSSLLSTILKRAAESDSDEHAYVQSGT